MERQPFFRQIYSEHIMSFNKMSSLLENPNELFSEILDNKQIIEIQGSIKKIQNKITQMKVDLVQESYRVYYGYVNKETLELKGVYIVFGTDCNHSIINKYLWIPNDEMPKEL